jgi:sensor c-di-GMP phosphodiesterase-like protein
MDDVGTGHSNLAYMQTLGVDVIKIDRVFVDMIKADTQQLPVLDGLIAMCRDLGTEIIAEGVETEAQALYLRARGVVMAQGFLFAPALKVGAFRELARALNGAPKAVPLIDVLTADAAA